MSSAWLLAVAVLTQVPEPPDAEARKGPYRWMGAVQLPQTPEEELLSRPEVRAFVGAPLCEVEQYARSGAGWVAAVQPRHQSPPTYFVVDARGRIDAPATERLAACLPASSTSYARLVSLSSGRGVVAGSSCLVTGDVTALVTDVWGSSWEQLAEPARQGAQPPPEVLRVLRDAPEYRALAPAAEPPNVQFVELPDSPYDLALVRRARMDPVSGDPPSLGVFVVGRGGGKTSRPLTQALADALRSEVDSVCGRAELSASASDGSVLLTTETEWGVGCQALITWSAADHRIDVQAHDVSALLHQRSRERLRAAHGEAQRRWDSGRRAEAIALWEQQRTAMESGADDGELCRALARAYVATKNPHAGEQLERCTRLPANQGEALLEYAAWLRREEEQEVEALAAYEHALARPLGDADRALARRAIVQLEAGLLKKALEERRADAARVLQQRVKPVAAGRRK